MNPVIVVPTFVSARRRREGGSVLSTYDHTTPLSQQGELPRLLRRCRRSRAWGRSSCWWPPSPLSRGQAAEKVQDIVSRFPSLNIAVIGADE